MKRSREHTKRKDRVKGRCKGVQVPGVPLSKPAEAGLSLCLQCWQQEAAGRGQAFLPAAHGKEGGHSTGDTGVITANLSCKDDP